MSFKPDTRIEIIQAAEPTFDVPVREVSTPASVDKAVARIEDALAQPPAQRAQEGRANSPRFGVTEKLIGGVAVAAVAVALGLSGHSDARDTQRSAVPPHVAPQFNDRSFN